MVKQNAWLLLLPLALISGAARADVKFTRLSEDQFIVHHRKQSLLGAEAKAMKTTFIEAASVCIAAGFSHMEIKETNVGERHHGGTWGGTGRGASADVRIELYLDPGEGEIDELDLLECEPLSDPKKVDKAARKLAAER
jgi:hypothetical protein